MSPSTRTRCGLAGSRREVMLVAALDLADRGWAVFPLAGKVPAIPNPHRRDSPERRACRGECGLPGHGMRDATCDPVRIEIWWARTFPGANIGARVPEPLLVVDVDPRHGGTTSLTRLQEVHGPLPQTLTVLSGRGDGGRHLYWRHPGGPVTARSLPEGLDLKTHSGYCVMPPSIHPEGAHGPYTWATTCLPAVPPAWLTDLLTPTTPAGTTGCPGTAAGADQVPGARTGSEARTESGTRTGSGAGAGGRVLAPARPRPGGSLVEAFNSATTWPQILGEAGWRCVRGDGHTEGSGWCHPAATSACSATITGDRLYVYSTNTAFTPTEPGAPRGYSRFDAWAQLHHAGDIRAALRHLRTGGVLA